MSLCTNNYYLNSVRISRLSLASVPDVLKKRKKEEAPHHVVDHEAKFSFYRRQITPTIEDPGVFADIERQVEKALRPRGA